MNRVSAQALEWSRQRKLTILFVLATILWHVLLLVVPWDLILPHRPARLPPPVTVAPIDPAKLEAIKNAWKKQDKSLLLSKDKTPPVESEKPTEKPKDANYMSDRNRAVEKEMRARESQVMPQPAPGQFSKAPSPTAREKPRPKEASPGKQVRLHELGVRYKLTPSPRVRPEETQPKSPQISQVSMPNGGDQALLDKSLPQGAENVLNSEASVYYSFYSRLYNAIGPIWQSRIHDVVGSRKLSPGDYLTVVSIFLTERGELMRIQYSQSSGVTEFDKVVEESWRRIKNFPNPPRELIDANTGLCRTDWSFNVSISGDYVPDFGPPARLPESP